MCVVIVKRKGDDMRCYSQFWLDLAAGRATLAAFVVNDALEAFDAPEVVEAEALDLAGWLRLPEPRRAEIVEAYAARRPPARHDGSRRAAA